MTAPSAVLELVRWPNALMSAAGVAIGAWWAGSALHEPPVVAAIVAALALAAFANSVNDIHDVEIDRVAHPRRPLPTGEITARGAAMVATVAGIVALTASLLVRPVLGALTLVVLLAMYSYSRAVKQLGVPGNVLVAVVASLPFLYGGWAAGDPTATIPLVVLAIPLHLAREIAKDLDDAPGDAASRRTLPVTHGAGVARVALMFALLAFCATLVPWVMRWPRFAIFVTPALVFCVLGAHRAWRGREGSPARFKAAMVLAMASLIALRTL